MCGQIESFQQSITCWRVTHIMREENCKADKLAKEVVREVELLLLNKRSERRGVVLPRYSI